jgi:hypothetical protein
MQNRQKMVQKSAAKDRKKMKDENEKSQGVERIRR